MKIYNHGGNGRGTIFVAPGKDHPETSDWIKVCRDLNGVETREAIQFAVKFENGCAVVPDNLGRYMLEKKLARKSPLILRQGALSSVAERHGPQAVGRPLDEVLGRRA